MSLTPEEAGSLAQIRSYLSAAKQGLDLALGEYERAQIDPGEGIAEAADTLEAEIGDLAAQIEEATRNIEIPAPGEGAPLDPRNAELSADNLDDEPEDTSKA